MDFDKGSIHPRVSIGAIHGGSPFRPPVSSSVCSLYVDIRLPPDANPAEVKREVQDVYHSTGVETKIEPYLYRRGYIARGVEPLAAAIERAHVKVFNSKPRTVSPSITSLWRDVNVFNGLGIPSVSYAPGVPPVLVEKFGLSIDYMVAAAKIYAIVAMEICGASI